MESKLFHQLFCDSFWMMCSTNWKLTIPKNSLLKTLLLKDSIVFIWICDIFGSRYIRKQVVCKHFKEILAIIENGSNDFILESNNNLIRIVFSYRIPFSKLNMSADDFIGHHVCQPYWFYDIFWKVFSSSVS